MKRSVAPLLFIVLLASTTFAQNVALTPETIVTGPFARPGDSGFNEWKVPSFAAGGRDGHYLIAWAEYPDATLTKSQLITAAIDATGRIVDGSRRVAPVLKTEFPAGAQFPAIAYDGERFLVVWIEGAATSGRLVAMRFDRNGAPIDALPQLVSSEARRTYVAATAGGGNFWITYATTFPDQRTMIARIASNGAIVERDRPISGVIAFWHDIETNGTSTLVASESSLQSAICITGFCSPAAASSILTQPSANDPWRTLRIGNSNYSTGVGSGLATDGGHYLIVSKTPNLAVSQWGWLILGQLTDATGTSIIKTFLIAKHQEDGVTSEPPGGRIDAIWTGTAYAIAYEQRKGSDLNVRLAYASPTGQSLIDAADIGTTAKQERNPVLLPLSDGRVLLLYERGDYYKPEIVARMASLSIRTRAVR